MISNPNLIGPYVHLRGPNGAPPPVISMSQGIGPGHHVMNTMMMGEPQPTMVSMNPMDTSHQPVMGRPMYTNNQVTPTMPG